MGQSNIVEISAMFLAGIKLHSSNHILVTILAKLPWCINYVETLFCT